MKKLLLLLLLIPNLVMADRFYDACVMTAKVLNGEDGKALINNIYKPYSMQFKGMACQKDPTTISMAIIFLDKYQEILGNLSSKQLRQFRKIADEKMAPHFCKIFVKRKMTYTQKKEARKAVLKILLFKNESELLLETKLHLSQC